MLMISFYLILLTIIFEPKKVGRHCFKRSKNIKTKNQLNDVVTFEIGMMVKLLNFSVIEL
jgi:hypothetical protein